MACPNQDEDQKIIAAIEQRKAETTEMQTQTIVWPGRLFDALMAFPEENICLIERVGENWIIVLKA